jgi:hypothetical protein
VTRQELFRRVIEAVRNMSPEDKAKARQELDSYLGLKKD